MADIFISYRHSDLKPSQIEKLVETLRKKGIVEAGESVQDVSEHLVPGSSIRGAIRSAVQSASKVILLWNDAGSKSQWVNYEAGMADALGKPIVVVIPGKSPSDLPESLKNAQVVRVAENA